MASEWPFDDPPNARSYSTKQVLEDGYPILLVTHDKDDGSWQVLCGTTNNHEDGRLVGLDCMYERDPTIGELADLPMGWKAWRESAESPWIREPNPHDYGEK